LAQTARPNKPTKSSLGLVSEVGSKHLAVHSGGKSRLFMDLHLEFLQIQRKSIRVKIPKQNKHDQQEITFASCGLE
jgi:hypothetical protein